MVSGAKTAQGSWLTRIEKNERIIKVIQVVLLLAGAAVLMQPMLIAWFNGSGYYVRGIDLIFGREVPGDKYGMVPQTEFALAGVTLVLALASHLMRNRDKGAFLTTLCTAVALVLFSTMLLPKSSTAAKTNPVIAAMRENAFQPAVYILLALLLLAVCASVLLILSRPAMRSDLKRHKWIYIMAAPVLVYVLIFFYYPMYGGIMAFKDYVPRQGILGSPWVGLDNFKKFFDSAYFWRLIRNTVSIGCLTLIFDFVTPILFALFLNEVTSNKFKRVVQTATYLPHFISLVVVCGLITTFLAREGLVNQVLITLGMSPDKAQNFLGKPEYYWAIYVISNIWQKFGWGSIVYFAAVTNIDPQLYEAAELDGATRMQKMLRVTLPGIAPTAVVMLIMAVGSIMNVGYEKTILLYNSQTYPTADIISSYVYRMGIVNQDYGYSTAVGLFNTLINLVLVVVTNKISRRVSETSLW